MKTKIASVVVALAFLFVAGASAQDSAGKTDWREQYASPGKDKSEVHKRRSPRGVAPWTPRRDRDRRSVKSIKNKC